MPEPDIKIGDKFKSSGSKWSQKGRYSYHGGFVNDTNLIREITITELDLEAKNGREVIGILDTGEPYSSPMKMFLDIWEKIE